MYPIVLAPIKGYTDPLWRSCYFKHFSGVDKVVTPFLLLSEHNRAKKNYFPRFLPELDMGIEVVPQFLVKRAESLLNAAEIMYDLGVREFNLNMGCPAPAIIRKDRGSGLLGSLDSARKLLDDIVPNIKGDFTVKIRTGIEDSSLLPNIIDVLNEYPLKEVIIHPRYAKQLYKGKPDMEAFSYGYKNSKNPVSYNGDVYTLEDYSKITTEFPDISSVMIGRGILRDPLLAESIKTGKQSDPIERKERLLEFIKDFSSICSKAYYKEITGFSRIKAMMIYIGEFYLESEESIKDIKRAKDLDQILEIISLN